MTKKKLNYIPGDEVVTDPRAPRKMEHHDLDSNKPSLTNDLVVEARIEYALKVIEDAQNKLDEACRATSSIIGFAPECRTIGDMSRKVKDLWYKIDSSFTKKRSKLKLDREPDEKWDAKYFR